MLLKSVIAPAVLWSAFLVAACGGQTPSAPSPPAAVPSSAPEPAPDVSRVLGSWTITAHVSATIGDTCVAEAVGSIMGASKDFSIQLTQRSSAGAVDVTVTSKSGDYDCVFSPGRADSSGFTTYGINGMYTCNADFATKGFKCSSGAVLDLITFGQDVAGTISGDEISGRWDISWLDLGASNRGADTRIEFTGRRR